MIDRKFEEWSVGGLVQLLVSGKRSLLDHKKWCDKWHIMERIATRHHSDEVGGAYCANEGGEIAEKCIAVVTFRRKKNT